MRKKYILSHLVLYFIILLLSYGIWICFSYLFFPFKTPPYNIILKQWSFNDYYKIKPGIYENSKYNTKFTINSKGFRSPEFSQIKSKAFRIICIGESSTMGIESNDWETWPSRLQHYLIKKGFDAEVINCGIGGATSSNHLAMLKNELIKYSPDLILYYAGFNDYATDNIERYPGPTLCPKGRWFFLKIWGIYKKIQLRFILFNLTGFDIESIILWPNQWKNKYKANLEAMAKETEKLDIPFLIINQLIDYPVDLLEALSRGFSQQYNIIKKISMRDNNWHYYLRQIDALQIQNNVAHNHNNVKIVNLYDELYKAKKSGIQLFYDVAHLRPRGNEIIGRTLAYRIKR